METQAEKGYILMELVPLGFDVLDIFDERQGSSSAWPDTCAYVAPRANFGATALHHASEMGNVEVVKLLLEGGEDVATQGMEG